MRRIFVVITIVALLSGIATAGSMKWAVGLTGGGNALDGIDSPAAGDVAMVITNITSTTSAGWYLYYAVAGTVAESSPNKILPNTNANGVTWWLLNGLVSMQTKTSSINGINASGTIGLYDDLMISTGSLTGSPVTPAMGGTGADSSAWSGVPVVSSGTWTLMTTQTCTTGQFVTAVSGTGLITCGAP